MSDAPAPEPPVIEVSGLWHRYAKDWALKGLDFTLSGTGVVGLLGSNGAGKSTLMNIVCGCLSQTKGAAKVDGLDVRGQALQARRRIGFLPQQAPLSLELTVQEYLSFCAGLRGMSRAETPAAVEFVMERCGLAAMRHRQIANLSGGYRQRTGIAQAVIHKPKLVILDEPTVGLDPNQILGVRALIEEIGTEHTVVFSTHILAEIEAMCREVLMVERGEIVFHGDMEGFRTVVEPSALVLTAQNPPTPEALKAELAEIDAVERLGPTRLRIRYAGGREIAPRLIALGQEKGWGIEELYFEKSSLEDAFAALSKGE